MTHAEETLHRLCEDLEAVNALEYAYQIGTLVGNGAIETRVAIDAIEESVRSKRLTSLADEMAQCLERGMSDAAASVVGYILVPGEHPQDQGTVEQSSQAFADLVIRALPRDAIYRMDFVVGELAGPPGHRRFVPVGRDRMRIIIDQRCKLARWKLQPNGACRRHYVSCNADLAGLVLEHAATHYLVREMRLLVNYPVYTGGDHFIFDGWADGIFFDEPPEIAAVQIDVVTETPADVLNDLVVDFPFADEASKQNFFGLMLTPLVRPFIDGNVPLHLVMASLARTGKSKLAEIVLGGTLLGEETPAMQMSGTEEEIDKRIISMLVSGTSIMHMDNLKEFLDSASICSLLTARTYTGRVLGHSRMIHAPNNLTLVGSGNNVRATNEIVERTVPIVLQPKTDSPSQRTEFAHPDLKRFVADNRRRVIATLIDMVLRWVAIGRPAAAKPMGGFESWASVVGGILAASGFVRWLDNYRPWVKSADPYGADWRAFVALWAERYQGCQVPARELLQLAIDSDLFSDLLTGGNGPKSNLTTFSRRVLLRNENVPCKNYIVRKITSGNNTRWRLEGETTDVQNSEHEF